MISALPALVDKVNFTIAVYDQIQVDTLMEAKPDLLQYLRGRLDNDSIDFTVSIISGEDTPATWTTRRVFEHMIETYPDFRDFVKDFNLTL